MQSTTISQLINYVLNYEGNGQDARGGQLFSIANLDFTFAYLKFTSSLYTCTILHVTCICDKHYLL